MCVGLWTNNKHRIHTFDQFYCVGCSHIFKEEEFPFMLKFLTCDLHERVHVYYPSTRFVVTLDGVGDQYQHVDPSRDLESEDQPLLGNQDQGEEWEEGKTLLQPCSLIVFPVVVCSGTACLSSFHNVISVVVGS